MGEQARDTARGWKLTSLVSYQRSPECTPREMGKFWKGFKQRNNRNNFLKKALPEAHEKLPMTHVIREMQTQMRRIPLQQ